MVRSPAGVEYAGGLDEQCASAGSMPLGQKMPGGCAPSVQAAQGVQKRLHTNTQAMPIAVLVSSKPVAKISGSAQARNFSAASTAASDVQGVMPDLRNATLRDAMARMQALGAEVEYQGEGRIRQQRILLRVRPCVAALAASLNWDGRNDFRADRSGTFRIAGLRVS